MATRYATFKVSQDLADDIGEIIKKGLLGYRSKNEFVNDAVRRRIEEIKKMYE